MNPQYIFETLPIHIRPEPLETFTSLLMRTAAANRLSSLRGLYETSTLSYQYRNPRGKSYIIDHPPPSLDNIAIVLACSKEELLATTFHYLVARFGREVTPHPMGIFLGQSLAVTLRFCPRCLAEQQEIYYSLLWRFSFLSGCAKHKCSLCDTCPRCGNKMPIFSAPFTAGRCVLCQADLRQAKTMLLSFDEQVRVQRLTEDLIYLLSVLNDSLSPSLRRILVRQQIAIMQHAAGKPRSQIHYNGPLLGYLHRLEAIGVNFRTFFDERIWFENICLQAPEHDETFEKQSIREALVRRIVVLQQEMVKTGLPITRQVIEDHLRIPLKQLLSYPEIHKILALIPNELLPYHQERRVRLEAELLPRIPKVLDQLEREGKFLSRVELGRALQIGANVLRELPGATTMLAERRAQRKRQLMLDKHVDHERELVAHVVATIAQMKEKGEQVTLQEICKVVGITYTTAKRYPQVKALLLPIREDEVKRTHEARWQIYRQTRDAELVEQITSAADLLTTEGKPVTPYAICRTLNMTTDSVKQYPRAWSLLDQYRSKQKPLEYSMSREEQYLITQLEAAIAHFDELGVCITQTVLCGHLHISMNDLAGRYPYAREMLLNAKERTRHRPRLQINNLYERVVGVIQMLETQHEPVTRHAICMRLQITVHTINRDPEVKALIDGVIARRSDAKAARRVLRENELIERLHKAYALLSTTQDVFSYTRLCIATGKDERTFRKYPRTSIIAKQLVAMHEQEVYCARENLVVILNTHTIEMLAQVAKAALELPIQLPDNSSRLLRMYATQVQRRDRDVVLAASVLQAIRELEQSGQEITSRAICTLTGWNIQTLSHTKYPQTRRLMHEVARHVGVKQRRKASRKANREAELVQRVRLAYANLQQSDQQVRMKEIARSVGLTLGNLRLYPAVKAELMRIRADIVSQQQMERQRRETELLTCLNAYVQQCEEQEQPLLISNIAQKLSMPLVTILGYPLLQERIEQIRTLRLEQRYNQTEREKRFF